MSKPSILIVDGNAHQKDVFPAVMEKYWFKDWTVVLAADCQEALQHLSERRFDVISVNLYLLPDQLRTHMSRVAATMGGADVSEAAYQNGIATIAAMAAAAPQTRIVAWSHYAQAGDATAARNAGACAVVDCRSSDEPLRAAILKAARTRSGKVRHAA